MKKEKQAKSSKSTKVTPLPSISEGTETKEKRLFPKFFGKSKVAPAPAQLQSGRKSVTPRSSLKGQQFATPPPKGYVSTPKSINTAAFEAEKRTTEPSPTFSSYKVDDIISAGIFQNISQGNPMLVPQQAYEIRRERAKRNIQFEQGMGGSEKVISRPMESPALRRPVPEPALLQPPPFTLPPSSGTPIKKFAKGGKVKETGLALVHKGEVIVPARRVQAVDKALKKAGQKPLKK